MKILVLSDSHASLRQMRAWIAKIRPSAVIHLGDHYDDGQALQEENPQLPFWLLPGNCDRWRSPVGAPEMLCADVCGVRLFMTHGHNHHVKQGIGAFLADARRFDAQAALYGHTHRPDCHQEPDGLWVLNPGSCGNGGSAGLIETENAKIKACRLLRQADLEDMV